MEKLSEQQFQVYWYGLFDKIYKQGCEDHKEEDTADIANSFFTSLISLALTQVVANSTDYESYQHNLSELMESMKKYCANEELFKKICAKCRK